MAEPKAPQPSHTQLRVEGVVWGIQSLARWPLVAVLPSYDSPDAMPGPRYHPLVWFINSTNVSVAGSGTINGAGSWVVLLPKPQPTQPTLF